MASTSDVTEVIAPQHEEAKRLLREVSEKAGEARRDAFHRLRLTLALHETAEEQAVHPQAMRQLGGDTSAASNRVEEEEEAGEKEEAGEVIVGLEKLDVDSDDFATRFDQLFSSVIAHATAEEDHEWPALREITDPGIIQVMVTEVSAVTDLTEDHSAPGADATFEQRQQWAKSRLPQPPST